MAGQSLSSYDAMLKDDYGPGLQEDLNNEVIFLNKLEDGAGVINFDGRQFIIPIHTSRNNGVGSRAENAAMPVAGAQGYVDFKLLPSYQYGAIKLTAQVMKQSRTDAGAFGRAMQREMEGLKTDFRNEMNFQFLQDGTGVRASVKTGVTSATVVITPVPYILLGENMLIDIWDIAFTTSPKYAGVKINSVVLDTSNATVTSVVLSQSVTVIATDVFVRAGSHGTDLLGLNAAVGNGTYGGIIPATYAPWQSSVLPNPISAGTLRPINYSVFQGAVDVAKNFGGGNAKYWFTRSEIRKNFFLFMESQRRIGVSKTYEGGFDSIEYDGKEIFTDQMVQSNVMYGIDPSYLFRMQTEDMHWIDDDGKILRQSYDGTDSFFSQMRWFIQLCCTKRNCQVKITDLQM
jgi:hypothetical protein